MTKTELAAVSLILTGCFSPDYGQRPFTCPQGACPSGYECREGVCVSPSETTDAGVDRELDVAESTQPDPAVNIVTETTKAVAECPDDEFAIGGGVNCRTAVRTSSVTEAGDWIGYCVANEAPTRVSAYCVRGVFTAVTWPRATGTPSAEAECSGQTLLAGGSCHCKDSWIVGSYPASATWHCDCHSGSALAVAHCVPFAAGTKQGLLLVREPVIDERSAVALCPPETVSIGGGCVGSNEGFRQLGNCEGSCYMCEMSEAAPGFLSGEAASAFCVNDTISAQ